MVITLFVILFLSYSYLVLKNGYNFVTLYWLLAYSFAFLLPVYLDVYDSFKYVFPAKFKQETNFYYLVLLIFFIGSNFITREFYKNKVKVEKTVFENHNAKRLIKIYFLLVFILFFELGTESIISGSGHLLHINPIISMMLPAAIFGSIFSAGLLVILAKSYKDIQIGLILMLMAVIFGLLFSFGRRLVIFPLLAIIVMYYLKKKKRPNVLLIAGAVMFGIFILMPYMINLRTFGFSEGTSKFIDLYTTDTYDFKKFIALSTDVSVEYSLATLIVASGVTSDPLTLLKPFFIFIPRSIWPNKPIPLSEHLVKDLGLSDVDFMSIPPGIVGELFTYFGIAGIIIGGILWGFITARFDFSVNVKKDNDNKYYTDISTIIIICFALQFITGAIRGDMSTGIQEAMYIFIPMYILLKFCKYKIKIK